MNNESTTVFNAGVNDQLNPISNQPTTRTSQLPAEAAVDASADFSAYFQDYLQDYQAALAYEKQPHIATIQVDELATKVARLYERIRRIIDWKEEHLVRRTAISRILKRNLLSEISGISLTLGLNPQQLTEPLVMDLIRSGYFSNGKISKNRLPEIEAALARYIYLLKNNPISGKLNLNVKEKMNFSNWVLELAACEIEQILDPALKENALLNLMTQALYGKSAVSPQGLISDEDKFIQIYVAVHRTLFNLDEPLIIYNLLRVRYPEWFENQWLGQENSDQNNQPAQPSSPSNEHPAVNQYVVEFTKSVAQIKKVIDRDLDHPYQKNFYRLSAYYDASYLILDDVMKKIAVEHPREIVNKLVDSEQFSIFIDEAYNQRIQTLQGRLLRSAIYSTLSIFLSGAASYILFEGPIATLVRGHFSLFALFVDLGVPTAIMFILVIIIRPPGKDNLKALKEEVNKVVYQAGDADVYDLNLKKRSHLFLNTIFTIISLTAGSITAYGIYMIFKIAGVPWTSLYIDTISVGMIIFAAMVIRDRSKEVTISEGGSFSEFLIDLFTIPLARVGQWFANKWREYNLFSVFFTVLVDTPFSAIIAIIEDWRSFIKDRRSELR